MNNRKVLALDLGTQTGWALSWPDKITSGSESFKLRGTDGAGMRFLRFKRWLSDINLSAGDIGEVYYEDVRNHKGMTAAHIYGGLVAHLTAWCEIHKIPYQGVGVGVIKRAATGQGNAKKDAMIAAAKAVGFQPVDDNEADAIHLLRYALKELVL